MSQQSHHKGSATAGGDRGRKEETEERGTGATAGYREREKKRQRTGVEARCLGACPRTQQSACKGGRNMRTSERATKNKELNAQKE